MSEKKVVENNEEQVVNETEKKPVASGKVKKTPKTEEKKGFFRKVGDWFHDHKEAVITGAVAFVGGAGTAVAGGYIYEKHQEKKRRESGEGHFIATEDDSLDPNV